MNGGLAFGKTVTVRVRGVDRYGRTVGQVILPDGRSGRWCGGARRAPRRCRYRRGGGEPLAGQGLVRRGGEAEVFGYWHTARGVRDENHAPKGGERVYNSN